VTDSKSLWVLRVVALALAVALWFFLSWEKRERQSERVVQASVTFDTAEGYTVLDPVREVEVRLRGGSRRVRSLNPFLVNVLVEVPEDTDAPVTLGPDNVYAPEGVEVVSLEPNQIQVTLDREITRSLPVRVELTGEPAAGATVGDPSALPSTVNVRGPQTRLESVRFLSTRPVSLDGHAQPFTETVSIVSPDSLARVEPSLVEVRVPMSPPQLSEEALAPPERPNPRN
jgi:YbbR domain-containing protein